MRIEGDTLIFSTGTKVRVHEGIVGLGEHNEGFVVCGGYDETLDDDREELPMMVSWERQELADFMIDRWQKFKDCAK